MNDKELLLLRNAVCSAGDFIREASNNRPRTSEVDTRVASYLSSLIHEHFPDETLVCEDQAKIVGHGNVTFFLDPHDGTADFLLGHSGSSISLGVWSGGNPVAGFVYVPVPPLIEESDGLLVSWSQTGGLVVEGGPSRGHSPGRELKPSSRILASLAMSETSLRANKKIVHPATIVQCPSIATRLALVAIGVADAAVSIRTRLHSWDLAGGCALVEGMGGIALTRDCTPIRWNSRGTIPSFLDGCLASRASEIASELCKRYLSRFPGQHLARRDERS